MDATKEPPLQSTTIEVAKENDVVIEASTELDIPTPAEVCHKPNGVAESDTEPVSSVVEPEAPTDAVTEENQPENSESVLESIVVEEVVETPTTTEEEVTKTDPMSTTKEVLAEEVIIKSDGEEQHEMQSQSVEIDGIVDTMSETVRFETEIVIETNVDDQHTNYKIIYEDEESSDQANNMLNDIGQSIELSDVLRSSDISENVENNNCEVAQEVFNKEELLDILEGNDTEESKKDPDAFANHCKKLETQLALQQLSRLKQTRKIRTTPKKNKTSKIDSPGEEPQLRKRSSRHKEDNSQITSNTVIETKAVGARRKSCRQDLSQSGSEGTTEVKDDNTKKRANKQKSKTQNNSDSVVEPKEQNIVSDLVQDWDDDDPAEGDQAQKKDVPNKKADKVIEESTQQESEVPLITQEAAVNESQTSNADTSVGEELTPMQNKNDSDSLPQRRQSRVIKKKVIFDPDNPDTFTKTKVTIKKEIQPEKDQKEQPTPKKLKSELTPRSKSKSPSLMQSKQLWKKPQPRYLRQHKRLTEIDRLLMDEGAVNMICQLTPEAPQGNKNTKSKAEFIKKIQSSTPEGKEMKFRERKKEIKTEEGDPKRIVGAKHRLSLNNSVKSPSVSEDFEAHSADDSIIYRRHSSSSYSSPCMSPRRMSDVEVISLNTGTPNLPATDMCIMNNDNASPVKSDVFMAEGSGNSPTAPVINKNNLMSMKEKLNSKLSQALNKRKREPSKPEKVTKVKRVSRSVEKVHASGDFKFVKLSYEQSLAEICIQSTGNYFNVEVMNELRKALETVESNKEVSVTLLTSETGTLCSGLDLVFILDPENGTNHAIEVAESVRLLLSTLEKHSKLVCAAVEEQCTGLALALLALSDITVASETASFQLSSGKGAPLQPGAAALTTSGLSNSLVCELLLLERSVACSAAQRGGLVSRAVWPARAQQDSTAMDKGGAAGHSVWPTSAHEQALAIARDIAAQPVQNVLLKKQILRLKRGSSETVTGALLAERDLFVKYWTSTEGQAQIRATLKTDVV